MPDDIVKQVLRIKFHIQNQIECQVCSNFALLHLLSASLTQVAHAFPKVKVQLLPTYKVYAKAQHLKRWNYLLQVAGFHCSYVCNALSRSSQQWLSTHHYPASQLRANIRWSNRLHSVTTKVVQSNNIRCMLWF